MFSNIQIFKADNIKSGPRYGGVGALSSAAGESANWPFWRVIWQSPLKLKMHVSCHPAFPLLVPMWRQRFTGVYNSGKLQTASMLINQKTAHTRSDILYCGYTE